MADLDFIVLRTGVNGRAEYLQTNLFGKGDNVIWTTNLADATHMDFTSAVNASQRFGGTWHRTQDAGEHS